MRLWRTTVEVEVFIASDEAPSDTEAQYAAKEELDNLSGDVSPIHEILSLKEIPKAWLDSVPQDGGNLTCQQIVIARLDELDAEKAKQPMPNQTALEFGE